MAEEAFALSPINARPNVPGEADYDAIREAFLETARGRWFLTEYAKRNRTADTNLLLEAVSRLETNLAGQKQQAQGPSLTAMLGAIRAAVRQAKATAIEVLPRAEGDDMQTAARNGARIIREIAWTLRECGADIRICDLLDTQVKVIETAQQAGQRDGREAVLTSYDALMERIEALADGPRAPTAEAPPASAPEAREASVTPLFKAPPSEPATDAPTETMRAQEPLVADTPVVAQPPADVVTDMGASDFDTADADDLAVLDAVAMEMGALDPDGVDADELFAPAADAMDVEPLDEAPAMAVMGQTMPAADELTLAQITAAALAPEPAPPAPASLGAALIANGVIAHPKTPTSDPLAPIRRMTQAEKIAFFS